MSKWAVLLGRNENWNLLLQGSEKNRDKICIGYYSFLFSRLTIHSYKTCSPQPWIIYHFFFSSRKVSRRRVVGKGTGALSVFVYLFDWCSPGLVKVELFVQVVLPLMGSDRKEGASYASLAQREMFALEAEHSGSPSLHFSHSQQQNSRSWLKFLPDTFVSMLGQWETTGR